MATTRHAFVSLAPAVVLIPVRTGAARLPRRYDRNASLLLRGGTEALWRDESITLPRPDAAHVTAARVLALSGEILAAVVIVGGGMLLTGLATLL
jgi:hypothetical protein